MNKAVIIGIIIAAAIGIGIASSIPSMVSEKENEDEKITPLEENIALKEPIPITEEEAEVEVEEPEKTGRDFIVELTESVGIKTP